MDIKDGYSLLYFEMRTPNIFYVGQHFTQNIGPDKHKNPHEFELLYAVRVVIDSSENIFSELHDYYNKAKRVDSNPVNINLEFTIATSILERQ